MRPNIKKLAAQLASLKKVKAVYLFGSAAKRKVGPLSDIDICVIAPHLSEEEKSVILSYSSKKVDLVLFDDLPLSLQARIFREGKPLFLREKNYIADLSWRTLKEYFDFKPVLKRFLETYLPGAHYV